MLPVGPLNWSVLIWTIPGPGPSGLGSKSGPRCPLSFVAGLMLKLGSRRMS
jgi:hypothetical protein